MLEVEAPSEPIPKAEKENSLAADAVKVFALFNVRDYQAEAMSSRDELGF